MTEIFTKNFAVFAAIGVINTIVDVALFVNLENAGLPILFANIISTSAALLVSFVLNSRFTFGNNPITGRRAGSFLLFTLLGLWILQPLVIGLSLLALDNFGVIHSAMSHFVADPEQLDTTVAKLAALPPTLFWNFFWYRTVVFKQS